MSRHTLKLLAISGLLLCAFTTFSEFAWIEAGQEGILPAEMEFKNPAGKLGYINGAGAIQLKGHPFFEPLGTNGRACVSCHQPKDAMSVSVESLRQRWLETKGKDPVFAAVDGSNNPKLPQELESSHSLLLNRGLFRIALPWPPKPDNGKAVKPEFTIEVVSDPTGVNLDSDLGLKSKNPTISVFRRPRPVANMTYVMSPDPVFNIKTGTLAVTDPETGKVVGMNMMADSRHYTQKQQAIDAYFGHLEGETGLSPEQQKQIVTFENQLFMAQIQDKWGNPLAENGEPAGLGPKAMRIAKIIQLKEIQISAYRASTLLSNGQKMLEKENIAAKRAEKIVDVFIGLGFPKEKIKLSIKSAPEPCDGLHDPTRRRVRIKLLG